MLLAGTAAGVLSALAVAALCVVSGDPPGVVVALVVATGLAAGVTVRRRMGGQPARGSGRGVGRARPRLAARRRRGALRCGRCGADRDRVPAAASVVSAARLSCLGVRAVSCLGVRADRADLERSGGVTLVVTGDGALTRPAWIPVRSSPTIPGSPRCRSTPTAAG